MKSGFHTVLCKFYNSAAQILREIKFRQLRVSKAAILTILEDLKI